jgi:thioester reductase-like protein
MKKVLITGATGVVGSGIVPLFLEEENTELYLLIRANSPEHLQQRFNALIAFWSIDPDDYETLARLKPLLGDTSLEHFGLDDHTYRELSQKTTCIVHCAADVSMNLTLAEARRGSVEAAKNIIEFALNAKLCGTLSKVEVLSTVGIAGRQKEPLLEQPLLTNRQFHNTYEQAKAEAEQLFFAAEKAGLPITIHRPSMIVGDSETGRTIRQQIFYYLCRFLSGSLTKSLLPQMDGLRIDIIPVDYVAKAIYLSSTQLDSAGRIFHLCSGPSRSIESRTLTDVLREAWTRNNTALSHITYLPMPLFRCLLFFLSLTANKKKKRALGSLSIFLDYAKDRQLFDNRATDSYFSALGLPVPKVETYLDNVLARQIAESVQARAVSVPQSTSHAATKWSS